MKKVVLLAVLLTSSSQCLAQTVMDHSDRKLTKAQRKRLIDAVDVLSTDPYRVEMRRVHMGIGGVFCGEMNGTNTHGGRNGYGRFYIDADKRDGLIDVPTINEMQAVILPKIKALCGEH